MELSIEKTKITAVEEGFDFLGYWVVQTKARRTGHLVGNLFIPKSKLKDLRHKIKAKVRETPAGYPGLPHRNAQSCHHRVAKLLSLRHLGHEGL
jgi:hypothetical protein